MMLKLVFVVVITTTALHVAVDATISDVVNAAAAANRPPAFVVRALCQDLHTAVFAHPRSCTLSVASDDRT